MHTYIDQPTRNPIRWPRGIHPARLWVVVLRACRTSVLERTADADGACTLKPVAGLDLRLFADAEEPDETVQARLTALLAQLLAVCQSGGRFDQMIVLGERRRRLWLRRYLNAATCAAIVLEAELPCPDVDTDSSRFGRQLIGLCANLLPAGTFPGPKADA